MNLAENLDAIRADYGCVCDDPENFCGGADIDPDEDGYCAACAALDGEEHCLVCPFDCCAQPARIDGGGAAGGAVQGGHGSLPDASGSGSPKSAHIDGSGEAT